MSASRDTRIPRTLKGDGKPPYVKSSASTFHLESFTFPKPSASTFDSETPTFPVQILLLQFSKEALSCAIMGQPTPEKKHQRRPRPPPKAGAAASIEEFDTDEVPDQSLEGTFGETAGPHHLVDRFIAQDTAGIYVSTLGAGETGEATTDSATTGTVSDGRKRKASTSDRTLSKRSKTGESTAEVEGTTIDPLTDGDNVRTNVLPDLDVCARTLVDLRDTPNLMINGIWSVSSIVSACWTYLYARGTLSPAIVKEYDDHLDVFTKSMVAETIEGDVKSVTLRREDEVIAMRVMLDVPRMVNCRVQAPSSNAIADAIPGGGLTSFELV